MSARRGFAVLAVFISVIIAVISIAGFIAFQKFSNKQFKTNQSITTNQTPPEVQEQKSDETTNLDQIGQNWKTYEDKHPYELSLKTSFKYPPTWYVYKDDGAYDGSQYFIHASSCSNQESEVKSDCEGFSVNYSYDFYENNDNTETVNISKLQIGESYVFDERTRTRMEDVVVDGVRGSYSKIEYGPKYEKPGISYSASFKRGKNGFEIIARNEQLLHKIVPTIKFLD